jgi:predicted ArsR family transcriptional regulator
MARDNYKSSIQKKAKLQIELRGTEYVDAREIAKKMKVSVRTITRYIDELINEEGIKIEKYSKKSYLYRIEDESYSNNPTFSEDEFNLIAKEIKPIESINKNAYDKLIRTIYMNLEDTWNYRDIIDTVKASMIDKTKLSFKYYSRDGLEVEDKKATAVYLDIFSKRVYLNYSPNGKVYNYNFENFETISNTEVIADPFDKFKPEKGKLDVFGFMFKNKEIEVELLLSMFAKSQLIRQFPIMEKYITPIKKNKFKALLKIVVYDIQPIARFVTGLFNEIKIEGSNDAKLAIENYYRVRVEAGYNENYINQNK